MSSDLETDVIIVGGGPVGLSAASDLDAKGIPSVVIESRPYLAAPNVKCNHVSSRTMEQFRRLGLAGKVREAGLPGSYPQDVSFRTTMTGIELTRIPIPARNRRYSSKFGPDTAWSTAEPPHRINQRYLEPVMMEHVAALRHVTLLNEHTYVGFNDLSHGVEARVKSPDGDVMTIRGKYLIGADGGRSQVRKQIGAKLSGDAVLANVQSTCIRAPGLYDLMQGAPAWSYYTANPRRNGHVYAIDGEEVFLIHTYLSPQETQSGSVKRDTAIRTILGVDNTFEYKVISNEDWVARRLVADKFRKGNVFIAGDACHLWVPYAGYGMNAGITDVLNLTWLLAAHLNGWADRRILAAYEIERLPITKQVSELVKRHQREVAVTDVPEQIEQADKEGEAARQGFARRAYDLNVQQFAAEGLNFGYVYDVSPIICYDVEAGPVFQMGSYVPSTAPGCRAPHFWLDDDVSLYDALGPGYTLIALDSVHGAEPLLSAAEAQNIPVVVVVVNRALAPAAYTREFTLVREDQHVAWRGDTPPADPGVLIELLRGSFTPDNGQ